MNRKKIYRYSLVIALILNIVGIGIFEYWQLNKKIPNNIKMIAGSKENFDFSLPVEAEIKAQDVEVLSNDTAKKIPKDKIHLDFNKPFTLTTNELGSFKMDVKLFGLLKIKEVNVDVIDDVLLVPSGRPIGIYVETDGIMVLGTSPIACVDGLNYEPALNILKTGDYITEINGQKVNDKKELISSIQQSQGEEMIFTIKRNEEESNVKIKPVKAVDGEYKIGTWIRDNTQGIGTLTYVSLDGKFGALGHGITDIDTSLLMKVKTGSIYSAKVMMIVKGEKGLPGELVGLINQNEEDELGKIQLNSNQGIFGKLNKKYFDVTDQKPVNIGLKQDIKPGKAYIRCQVEGEMKDYEIEIEKVEWNHKNLSKGLVLKITDERLLNCTNGIVQGMSGSPIIQNGKLIGAVTHVFIQDSTKGYGTFIENMLKTAE